MQVLHFVNFLLQMANMKVLPKLHNTGYTLSSLWVIQVLSTQTQLGIYQDLVFILKWTLTTTDDNLWAFVLSIFYKTLYQVVNYSCRSSTCHPIAYLKAYPSA